MTRRINAETMNPSRANPVLSVVIPAYNERMTIAEIVARVDAVPIPKEIIIVDDCSRDGTWEELTRLENRHPSVRIFRHEQNRGKGAALRTGLSKIRGRMAIIQDADLEYDPADYGVMLTPILSGKADVVYGSRFLTASARRVHFFWHYIGNKVLTLFCNMFSNLNLTDMETCYKAFRREVVADLVLEEERFGFEPEVTIKIARGGWRFYEVGISYSGRTYQEGKKIGWRDGVRAFWCIVKYGLTAPHRRQEAVAAKPTETDLTLVKSLVDVPPGLLTNIR
jgi:glycosyltransferase involved in cell wall biosynthesis